MKQTMDMQLERAIKHLLKLEYLEKKDVFVVKMGSISEVISANFIRHQLGIPYTKKNGIHISAEDIELSKRKSRRAFAEAMTKQVVYPETEA